MKMIIFANFVDLKLGRVYPAEVSIGQNKIGHIQAIDPVPADAGYLLPGFVDAHVHIESSRLPPAELACCLQAPFMVLSFLALPVIPDLKMTDLGLFDGRLFSHTNLEL